MDYKKTAMSIKIKDIGARPRSLRKQAGETQTSWGKATGISQGYVGQIERGERIPPTKYLIWVAQRSKVSIDWIVFGGGHLPPGDK